MSETSRRRRIARLLAVFAAVCLSRSVSHAAEPLSGPFVFEGAGIHDDQIVFSCGGKLWLVSVDGGSAKPITTGAAHDSFPCFSPDGKQLAFLRRSERLSGRPAASPDEPPPTAAVFDVYVRDMATSEERRLTHHPSRDVPVGWTVDSQKVLFCSQREGLGRLFTMSPGDQLPAAVPLPRGATGSFSPDGRRMAYLPRSLDYNFDEFRHYRGGKCSPLWLVELHSGAVEKITDGTFNVRDPMWVEEHIYFLSDREGRFALAVYDLTTKEIRTLAGLKDFGARNAAADGRSIVLVGDGSLQVFDLFTERVRQVQIAIDRDEASLRPRVVNALNQVQSFSLGQDGKQAVVCARGDVFLVDTESGRAVNVTRTSGVAEREARVSPDGKRLAYFSDVSGECQLVVRGVDGGNETQIAIEPRPTFYRELTWSPDGKCLAFSDKRLGVWLADLATGHVKQIDRSTSSAQDRFSLNWSADSRYLAYGKYGDNRLPRVFVYDRPGDAIHPVTPVGCYAAAPAFDKSGRYLYFLSSPNAAMADYAWGVMAGVLSQPLVVRRLNAVVLSSEDPAPVVSSAPNPSIRWKERPRSTIDFDGIETRIVPIDVTPHSPSALATGEPGVMHLIVDEWSSTPGSGQPPTRAIYRLDLRSPSDIKKTVPLVDTYAASGDGNTILCGGRGGLRLATFQGAKVTLRPVSVGALPVPVDPSLEWKQIFHEAWRLMRDFFYDPNLHGLDWAAIERHYAEFLPAVRSREELNVLLRRMLGHVSVSHLGVAGGDISSNVDEPEPVGLLGADLEVSQGLYRVKRVLRSGDFDAGDPSVRAPLAQLGDEVADGEYLFAIDDEPLDARQNIYEALRGKALRPVRLRVGPSLDGAKARTVRVVPLANETALRMADWSRHNAEIVRKVADGRLGYFHMPSYSTADVQTFFRGYFKHRDKPGIILDQRHNGGGITPDFFIETLARRPLYYYRFRDGDDLAVPVNGRVESATVLLIDDDNGSAAETFAFMFQLAKVGPLVGARTLGAGIGPYGAASAVPPLVDGGRLQIPSRGAYNPRGRWGIENEGVRPDVAVDIMPEDWRAGRDPQLEAAVQAGLEALKGRQPTMPRRPEFPVHP